MKMWISTVTLSVVTSAALAGPPVEYTVTNLGEPPGGAVNVIPRGLNDQGEAVGWSFISSQADPPYQGWKWSQEEGMMLLPPPSGDDNFTGVDINESGQIGGSDFVAYGSGSPWRLDGEQFTFTGLPAGTTWALATGINNSGDIAGYGNDYSPGSNPALSNQYFIFTDALGIVDIPDGPGQVTGIGRINDNQVVTGTSTEGAFRWTIEDGMELLPHLYGESYGYDINEQGQVSGIVAIENEKYGARYTDGVGWELIVNLLPPGGQEAPGWERGLAINNQGDVVGYSEQDNPHEGYEVAWVWTEEHGVQVLDNVIDMTGLPDTFHVFRAVDINDSGQILAEGSGIGTSGHGAFLLTPVVDPQDGDIDGDGTVDAGDLLLLLAGWATPDADIDGNGTTDASDLLILMANWTE